MTTTITTATTTDHAAAFSEGGTHHARQAALRLLPSRQAVLLAADWAETVLPILESAHPDDPRPRRAIEAARADTHAAYAAYTADAADAADAAYAAYAAAYAAYAAYTAYTAYYAAYAAAYAAYAAANAGYAAANAAGYAAANAAAYAAYAAANAANVACTAVAAGGWQRVHARWRAAWHGGRAFDPAWRTPLAVELAKDPEAYPVLLDHLSDLGADVDDLRKLPWGLSNWAVYHDAGRADRGLLSGLCEDSRAAKEAARYPRGVKGQGR